MLILVEILSVIGTVVYIYLAVKKKAIAWFFGIVASALSAWLFYHNNLYGSSLLNIIYALLGIAGFINWNSYIADKEPSYGIKWYFHLLWIAIGTGLSFFVCELLNFTTGETILYADVLLAIFSILATVLEIRKDISTWWYWIICNLAFSGLYLWKSLHTGETLYLYSLLMLGLAVFSCFGLQAWSKGKKKQEG